MSKVNIKASQLISTLKNSKLKGDSQVFLEQLLKMRDNFDFANGKLALSVEIDTDEDFFVEGRALFVGKVSVNPGETPYEALIRYFETLSIKVHENKKYKVEELKASMKSKEFEVELNVDGEAGVYGNNELKVKVINPAAGVECGDMIIDLSQ